MNTKTCKDCACYSPSPLEDSPFRGFCEHPALGIPGPPKRDQIVYYSEYLPEMGPDFGCVHWEPK